MIELSYNAEELMDKIYEISENHPRACFVDAITDMLKDALRVQKETKMSNSMPMERKEYQMKCEVEIEGKAIYCHYVNASCEASTRSGEARIVTPYRKTMSRWES